MSALEIISLIAAVLGIVGSIVPGLPGPPLSWVGMLLVFLAESDGRGTPMSTTFLLIWLGITVAVTILDYILPAKFTSLTGGHKGASTGALIGLFAGIFFTPVGMLGGSLLGAFIGELVTSRGTTFWQAAKAALGAFVGFIVTTGMKTVTSCIMAWIIIDYIF